MVLSKFQRTLLTHIALCLTFLVNVLLLISESASAQTLLVANKDAATLSVLNTNTNKISHVIQTGIGPHEVAVSPNQQYALVSNYGDQTTRGNSLTLVDLSTGTVVKTIVNDAITRAHGIQWFKDNQHVLVTSETNKKVVKINPFSGNIIAEIKTEGLGSHMLVLSPDESYAAVTNLGSGDISIINLTNMTLVKQVKTGQQPEGVDISPDNKFIWVTNRGEDTVSVIDAKTFQETKKLSSKGFPIRVKVSPDQKYALVTNAQGNSLTIFDAHTFNQIITLSFEKDPSGFTLQYPIGVLIDNQSEFAYVAHMGGSKISKIDLATLERVKMLDGGSMPDGMAYLPTPIIQ